MKVFRFMFNEIFMKYFETSTAGQVATMVCGHPHSWAIGDTDRSQEGKTVYSYSRPV